MDKNRITRSTRKPGNKARPAELSRGEFKDLGDLKCAQMVVQELQRHGGPNSRKGKWARGTIEFFKNQRDLFPWKPEGDAAPLVIQRPE